MRGDVIRKNSGTLECSGSGLWLLVNRAVAEASRNMLRKM